MSSIQHEKGFINWTDVHFEKEPEKYKGFTAYNQSKLANVMHAKALSRKLKTEGIKVYVLHPGMMLSKTFDMYYRYYKKVFIRCF